MPDDYIDATLTPRLGRIIEFVVRACASQLLQRPPSGHFFGLYGADIILDDNLTPWLTEIQKGPGLSHDDAIKRDIIPPMLSAALDFVLQVLERKRSGKAVDGLPLARDYFWVIGA